ncbi:SDR family NAD(P)-dependent oxidoreductase [Sorangium sp. So ce513]|uniref:SDR family NAD(P)-dependent oxidoreductase n=1 Tax=Sorangium sp. So ce513 TaxID=3133315 RepID=UPI003F621207
MEAFFVVPYCVKFEDSMAYGSHHYLTNFRFQCIARETLYFAEAADGSLPHEDDRAAIRLLTTEGYSRNLAPVRVGERVAIFMTLGAVTRSSAYGYFRTVRFDGEPVACGYQRIVAVAAASDELAPLPRSVTMHAGSLDERVPHPRFVELALRGGSALRELFPERILRHAVEVARTPLHASHPHRKAWGAADEAARGGEAARGDEAARGGEGEGRAKVALLLPGQGSFDLRLLRALHARFDAARAAVAEAEPAARALLGASLAALVDGGEAEARAALDTCPDLDQLGILVQDHVAVALLRSAGLAPDVVAGHSFGEIAALAAGGAFSLATAAEVVCRRVLALRGAPPGRMLAAHTDAERLRDEVQALGRDDVFVAVVNAADQAVASGTVDGIAALERRLAGVGVRATVLASRHAFHSPLLAPAVGPFAGALARAGAARPALATYSPIDRVFHGEGPLAPARLLPMHLVTPLDFGAAVRDLLAAGCRTFVECGGGSTLTALVRRNAPREPGLRTIASFRAGEDVAAELRRVVEALRAAGHALTEVAALPGGAIRAGACAAPAAPTSTPAAPAAAASTPAAPAAAASTPAAPAAAASTPAAPAAPAGAAAPPIEAAAGPRGDGPSPEAAPPIAIVGMGAVLPGAGGVEAYLEQLLAGTSGIVDSGVRHPELATDFLSQGGRAPDKTYSLLTGAVDALGPYAAETGYDARALDRLPKTARMLACALAEARARAAALRDGAPRRIVCLLGSTADGSIEHDEATLLLGVERALAGLGADAAGREAVVDALAGELGLDPERRAACRGHLEPLARVVRDVVGEGVRTVVVDAACASSMHAVHLGAAMLRRGLADVVIAGGAYQPGPTNACQFSQFGGLSATGSRPFDASADGVVFGEGAAVVVLERLDDARARGDRVDAVLLGSGLSSDGPSPSVTVPQSRGQSLAMRRAYARAGVAPRSVQYVEAHATATPVGDATELKALAEVFAGDAGAPRIALGSVKSLLGHTGWTAGVASLIKVVLAMRERTIFPQHGFEAPSARIDLERSPFVIPGAAAPWTTEGGAPRRAALDSFGFGGTNAHLVVEEPRPDRGAPRDPRPSARAAVPETRALCVVGLGAVFPGAGGAPADAPSDVLAFDERALRLPAGARVLPDALEAMDPAQLLAVMAADRALAALPARELGDRIGVVVGHEGKTRRGARANERIFGDRVARALRARGVSPALAGRVVDALRAGSPATGPYTQPGNMPNVIAGRVANVLGLRGPNFVVDTSATSLLDALAAADLVLDEDCEVVLAGAVNAFSDEVARGASASGDPRPVGEAALLVALCTEATAARHAWPVLARLRVADGAAGGGVADGALAAGGAVRPGARLRGAEGAIELHAAIRGAREHGAAVVRWPSDARAVEVSPPGDGRAVASGAVEVAGAGAVEVAGAGAVEVARPAEAQAAPASAPAGFTTGTPIQVFVPRITPAPATAPAARVPSRVLHVCTDAALAADVRRAAPAGARVLTLAVEAAPGAAAGASPPASAAPGGGEIPSIDARDEARLHASFAALASDDVDAVVVLTRAADARAFVDGAPGAYRPALRALFGAARRYHDAIARGDVSFAAVVLGAVDDAARLAPVTGAVGGFVKSLARELPSGDVRVVHTDARDAAAALGALAAEWRRARPTVPEEVVDLGGVRHTVQLARASVHGAPGARSLPPLGPGAVALVTGGARGITAQFVEGLLERFGCRAVLLGRSRIEDAPPRVLAMTDAELDAYERDFYAEALRAEPGVRMAALRERYGRIRAAREAHRVLTHLRSRGGVVDYHAVDVTRGEDVDRAVAAVAAAYGRIDLIVHGAGIQVSSRLTSKSLDLFERIVDTKLAGLSHLRRALARHLPDARPHVHLVTSAFSVLGNDGQPDYGAANEAMNRAAAYFAAEADAGPWSSIAWLGWNGVGMTAGSEYSALGAARGLRGIEPEEGRRLFLELAADRPVGAAQVLLTDSEIERFAPRIAESAPVDAAAGAPVDAAAGAPADGGASAPANVCASAPATAPPRTAAASAPAAAPNLEWTLDPRVDPWLADHRARSSAVAAGAFLVELAVRHALATAAEGGAVVREVRDVRFLEFLRLPDDNARAVRTVTARRERLPGGRVACAVEVRGDFVHRSGVVLRADIVFATCVVELGALHAGRDDLAPRHAGRVEGPSVRDPYALPGAPVRHAGWFDHVGSFVLGTAVKSGRLRLPADRALERQRAAATPFLLLDALLTLGTLRREASGAFPVCAAAGVARIRFGSAANDLALRDAGGPVRLLAAVPEAADDRVLGAWAQALDPAGGVLLDVEGLEGRVVGRVTADARPSAPAWLSVGAP